jgi:hypothetical protein
MTHQDAISQRIKDWEDATPTLQALRDHEIATADNLHVLALLESAFNQALTLPMRPFSGLVEMQQWFAKLRR